MALIPTSIAPWFSVRDTTTAVGFYKLAFGAIEVYRMEEPEGLLQVARLSVDGAEFWLGAKPDKENVDAQSLQEHPIRMILTISDPDALFERALEAGASQVFPVSEEYGWRLGRLIDPFGFHWEIGRPLEINDVKPF